MGGMSHTYAAVKRSLQTHWSRHIDRLVDLLVWLKMKDGGASIGECAQFLGVTKKRAKELMCYAKPRVCVIGRGCNARWCASSDMQKTKDALEAKKAGKRRVRVKPEKVSPEKEKHIKTLHALAGVPRSIFEVAA